MDRQFDSCSSLQAQKQTCAFEEIGRSVSTAGRCSVVRVYDKSPERKVVEPSIYWYSSVQITDGLVSNELAGAQEERRNPNEDQGEI